MNDQGTALRIDVYSDVVCPWCYVGKRRLERALASAGTDVHVTWRPFQLNPTMPRCGMDRREYLEAKFGGPAATRSMYDRVTEAGAAEQLLFAFDRIQRTPNTFDAHRMIWHAGRFGKQERMVETLFRCFFVEGLDIGNVETLVQAATQVGLDRASTETFLVSDEGVEDVKGEESVGRRMGIRGVPYFVLNGAYTLSGAQPSEQFVAAFRQLESDPAARMAGY